MIVAEFIGGGPWDGHTVLLDRAEANWRVPVPPTRSVYVAQDTTLPCVSESVVYVRASEPEGRDKDGLRIYRYTLAGSGK